MTVSNMQRQFNHSLGFDASQRLFSYSARHAVGSARERHTARALHRCEAAAVSESAAPVTENGTKTVSNVLPAPRPGQLARQATAYLEEHRIRSYEVDPNQRTTMVTIANLLQVCNTGEQFSVLGQGTVEMWDLL